MSVLKAVDKTLLEVSAKKGEAKSNKELEFFNATGFHYDQELGEPPMKITSNVYNITWTNTVYV